ncbi:MAG TPA: glycosyltransferase 87 family protein [Gemmataceae bacterium]|nr:glycosyltransferase 87 family protein [Gemmataceae bacterium]
MIASGSIFFEITLPNATTWFYFSALLAVALFFKFTRLLSIRNADVLTLFLPMPGLLLLIPPFDEQLWGYLWLLAASGFFLVRCVFDLTLVRRPALSPNLNFSGLVWLAGALFVSLIAVAVRHPNSQARHGEEPSKQREAAPGAIDPMRRQVEKVILKQAPAEVDQEALDVWVERGLTVLCHLVVAVGLILIGWRHFEDLHAGMAAATFYLLLPYTFLLMPRSELGVGRWDHAWPMALMIWMVLCYRRPTLAGIFLGLAAGTVFFPILVLPLWLSFYHRRGALRFGVSFVVSAGLCLAIVGLILWLNDALPRTLMSSWNLSAWLPWKRPDADMPGLWQGQSSHWAYRIPIFVVYVAFVVTTAFWPSPKNLAHVLALTAALLIGIQFWYADRGGVYVLWYLPLLLLLVFRPNLSACQPQPPRPDWLARLGRRLAILARRTLRLIRPARRGHQVSRLVS